MPPPSPPIPPREASTPKSIPSSPYSPSSFSLLPLPTHVQTYKSNEPTATLDFSPFKTLQYESNVQSWNTISSWLDTFRVQSQPQDQAQHQSQSRSQSEPQTQLQSQPSLTALPDSESKDTGTRTGGNKTPTTTNLSHKLDSNNIEKNPSTLSALQQLMRANLSTNANHKRLNDAVVKQIGAYSNHDAVQHRRRDHAQGQDQDQEVLEFLKQNLSREGKEALEVLAETSVVVGVMPSSSLSYTSSISRSAEQPSTSQITRDDADAYAADFDRHTDFTTTLGKRIIDLTQDFLDAQSQLSELNTLRKEFEGEKKQIERDVQLIREPDGHGEDKLDEDRLYSPLSRDERGNVHSGDGTVRVPLAALHGQTSEFNVFTKQLQLKIREYQDRIAALTRTVEAQTRDEDGEELTIESVQQMESTMQRKRAEVQKLEERLKKYHGLPPDVEASRAEVARATNELESWRRRRETIFEEMGR